MSAGIVFNRNQKILYIYIQFIIKRRQLINIVRSLSVYEAITQIDTQTFNKHLQYSEKGVHLPGCELSNCL